MIPPQIAATAPSSEKWLFARLQRDPDTREWVVFHSFDIRRHVRRTAGEADLVVVVPGLGVLCIEVKGCGITRNAGLWTYHYDPPRTSSVGPFRQASDATHSLRESLAGREGTLASVVFYSAVFFTEIDFPERSFEWEPWQSIGKTQLLRRPVSEIVTDVLQAAHAKLRAVPKAWYGTRSGLDQRHVQSLIRLMRPDFEYPAPVGGLVRDLVEQSIRRFTEEQFDALDLIDENPRMLFKGPAGTGKTLLAIEAARRSIQSGRSTALICFNNLLGGWLRRETDSIAVNARETGVSFYVGTLSALMVKLIGGRVPPDAGKDFWSRELPTQAVDVLLSEGAPSVPYDLLVLDEAQDVLSDPMLDVLELLVTRGLAAGNWAMFGDLEKQAIFSNSDAAPGLERLRSRTAERFFTYPLRINCRNSESIATLVTLASGLTPGYSRVLSNIDAPEVEPISYRNGSQQAQLLANTIRKLLKTFIADQIVVLSMRSDDHSSAMEAGRHLDGVVGLVPLRDASGSPNDVRYASVHAFKGLESAAIVLTDIESIDDDQARSLLYVGMTRARVSLVVFMHERVSSKYSKLLMDGYKAVRKEGLT